MSDYFSFVMVRLDFLFLTLQNQKVISELTIYILFALKFICAAPKIPISILSLDESPQASSSLTL